MQDGVNVAGGAYRKDTDIQSIREQPIGLPELWGP